MRLCETFDVFVTVASQAHLNLVFPIERKIVVNGRTTSSTEWQTVKVTFLCQVGRNQNRIASRRAYGAADRQTADFLRRGQISFQQGRRKIGDRDVIEAGAGVITWEKRVDLDI